MDLINTRSRYPFALLNRFLGVIAFKDYKDYKDYYTGIATTVRLIVEQIQLVRIHGVLRSVCCVEKALV